MLNIPETSITPYKGPEDYFDLIPPEVKHCKVINFFEKKQIEFTFNSKSKDEITVDIDFYLKMRGFLGLNSLVSLEFFGLNGVGIDMDLIGKMTNINSLVLRFIHNDIINITPISNLKNLTSLMLQHLRIQDLTPISYLENLKSLVLYELSVREINAVSRLTNLISLKLTDVSINNLELILNLSQLKHLDLSHLRDLQNINPISKLKNLNSLELFYLNNIQDLTPISYLENLTSLILRDLSVQDISPISELKNLTSLILRNLSIRDINPVSELKNLTSLILRDLSVQDISPISELKNLTSLELFCLNNIQDINPISEFKNLNSLILFCLDDVQDINPISELDNLRSLELSCLNNVQDISLISEFKNLNSLKLFHLNDVQDITPILSLTNINDLKLSLPYLFNSNFHKKIISFFEEPNVHDELIKLPFLLEYHNGFGVVSLPHNKGDRLLNQIKKSINERLYNKKEAKIAYLLHPFVKKFALAVKEIYQKNEDKEDIVAVIDKYLKINYTGYFFLRSIGEIKYQLLNTSIDFSKAQLILENKSKENLNWFYKNFQGQWSTLMHILDFLTLEEQNNFYNSFSPVKNLRDIPDNYGLVLGYIMDNDQINKNIIACNNFNDVNIQGASPVDIIQQ